MVWLIVVTGLAVDARRLPRAVQVLAFERGVIPYVPADRDRSGGDGGTQAAKARR
jgi:hypothetical protein